jgi:uncharacterized membrane protein YbhN (UPF0104 family)
LGILALPLLSHGLWVKTIARVPKVGLQFVKLATAVELYRRKIGVLFVVFAMSLMVSVGNVVGLYLATAGLFSADEIPSMQQQAVIIPLASLAGAIPITPAGVGTFEFATDYLFRLFAGAERGQGLMVALAYRVMTILIAAIGIGYYWASRREVAAVLEAVEHDQEAT